MSEECLCGFEAKDSRGLSAHQRYCDEYQDSEGDSLEESDEDPNTVSTRGESEDLSDFEEELFERDDYSCRNCGADGSVAHFVDEDGPEAFNNAVTLCDECDGELEGVAPPSKKTQMRS